MKSTEEMITVMQAYADGKEIEWFNKIDNKWLSCINPTWNWLIIDYRVKPESSQKKIIPYENAEEFLKAQKEHGPYILIEDAVRKAYVIPIAIKDEGVYFTKEEGLVLYSSLVSMFHTWQDGSPVGKKIKYEYVDSKR